MLDENEHFSVFRDVHGRVAFEFEIKEFFETDEMRQGLRVESPSFPLSNAWWSIQVYPKGYWGIRRGWVSLFLTKKTKMRDSHHLSFSLGIKKKDGLVLRSFNRDYIFDDSSITCGIAEFMKISDVHASQKGSTWNAVTFFCMARAPDIKDRTEETASQTFPMGVETLSNNLTDLYLAKRFSDVKIYVKGLEFKAHKSVLAARSPVFASTFEHDMTESSSGVVDIPDCDTESFENFLLFLYSGKFDYLSSGNLLGLYKTADKYDVKELKEECRQRLTNEMSVDLVCDVVHFAVVHDDAELLNTATQYFIDNAHGVLTTEKWKHFQAECADIANELLIKMVLQHKEDT